MLSLNNSCKQHKKVQCMVLKLWLQWWSQICHIH